MYNNAILPALLIQQMHRRSKMTKNTAHLQRRLAIWVGGSIATLVEEEHSFQKCHRGAPRRGNLDIAGQFGSLMTIPSAGCIVYLSCETTSSSSNVLGMNETITFNFQMTSVHDVLVR